MGELALLDMLQPYLAVATPGAAQTTGLQLGPGDDSALWRAAGGSDLAITTDSLVENVHFRRPLSLDDCRDLGWKLLTVSLSDLAAMAAAPGPAFISLSLPGDWEAGWLVALYEGLAEVAGAAGACLAGGNITAAPSAVMTSTCIGEVARGAAMTRAGARPGWILAVTGQVGGSAAALRAEPADEPWRRRLHRPQARLTEARLAAENGIRVAIDVSDGLFADAARLLDSDAGAATGLVLDASVIPVAPGVREAWPDTWLEVAGGGEDYELLLGGPATLVDAAVAAIGGEARVIGRFDAGAGVRVLFDGAEHPAPVVGHQHFD